MAPYGRSSVIQFSGRPEIPNYLHLYLSQTLGVNLWVLARTPSDELNHMSKGANTVFSPNLGASWDFDYTGWAILSFFSVALFSPHLLNLFERIAVLLWSSRKALNFKLHSAASAKGWADNDWIYIFGRTHSLINNEYKLWSTCDGTVAFQYSLMDTFLSDFLVQQSPIIHHQLPAL